MPGKRENVLSGFDAKSAEKLERLEALVDASSPAMVVEAIAVICELKADHVRTNWQDEPLARRWERAGKALTDFLARNKAIWAVNQ